MDSQQNKVKRVYKLKREDVSTLPPDHEFHSFKLAPNHVNTIPVVDLRSVCPPVYDQGTLGSCTANSLAAAYEVDQIIQKENSPFVPSRLFIYYNERNMEGTVNSDDGAQIKDGVTVLNTIGVCPESMWPYDVTKFAHLPPPTCYKDSTLHRAITGLRVRQDLNQIKQALLNGFPMAFGFTVYESFEGDSIASTGIMTMPSPDEQNLGGHAVLCVGYDDHKKVFIVRNSWGASWGDKGYFYMPYDYMTDPNLASDFWTIKGVVDKEVVNPTVAHPLKNYFLSLLSPYSFMI